MSTENALKTPAEWCLLEGVEILDPDGWRGHNGRPWEDPITLAEFRERLIACTQRSVAPQSATDWRTLGQRDSDPRQTEPETLVLVSRSFESLAPTWHQHAADIDTVLRNVTDRARDGKASALGYDVIEVTVTRRFHVQPVITTAEVTEVTA